jgi:hypothetical protein
MGNLERVGNAGFYRDQRRVYPWRAHGIGDAGAAATATGLTAGKACCGAQKRSAQQPGITRKLLFFLKK